MPQILRDILLILVIVVVLLLAILFAPLNITLTICLLFGVWVFNTLLKAIIGFLSGAAFADLSFASLIFSGSRSIDRIGGGLPPATGLDDILYSIIGTGFLGILWAGNLYIIRGLAYNQPDTGPDELSRRIITSMSTLIAIFSVAVVLILQYWGLI